MPPSTGTIIGRVPFPSTRSSSACHVFSRRLDLDRRRHRQIRTLSRRARAQRSALQRERHRVLLAGAELRAVVAVGLNLLRQPRMRHHRESQPDEMARRMRERAQRREAIAPRGALQLLDQLRAQAAAAVRFVDDERSHFGDGAAERRELGAAGDLAVHRDDDEAVGMTGEVFAASAAADGLPRDSPRSARQSPARPRRCRGARGHRPQCDRGRAGRLVADRLAAARMTVDPVARTPPRSR